MESSPNEESRSLLSAKPVCRVGVLIEIWSETRSGKDRVGRVVERVYNCDVD